MRKKSQTTYVSFIVIVSEALFSHKTLSERNEKNLKQLMLAL